MPLLRSWMRALRRPQWLCLASAMAAVEASALGFGAASSSAELGRPLDFAVQLRLDAGEVLEARCVRAEVGIGERTLPAALVRTQIEAGGPSGARLRVLTTTLIDEPVVSIQVEAGCAARVTRRYVLMADLPQVVLSGLAAAPAAAVPTAPASAPTAMMTLPVLPVVALAAPPDPGERVAPLMILSPAAGDVGEPDAAAGAGAHSIDSALAPADSTAIAAPVGAPPATPATAPARSAAVISGTGATSSPAPRRTPTPAARPLRSVAPAPVEAGRLAPAALRTVAVAVAAPPPAGAGPRLRLDPAEAPGPAPGDEIVDQALLAVAEAASAARAAIATAGAQSQRIADLERSVAQLRDEAQRSRAASAELQAEVASARDAARWTTPLLVGAGVLALLAGWLMWRLNELQRLRQSAWREAGAAAAVSGAAGASGATPATKPIPLVNSELPRVPPADGRGGRGSAPAWPPPAPADSRLGAASVFVPPPPDVTTEPGALAKPVAGWATLARAGAAPAAGPAGASVGAAERDAVTPAQRTQTLPAGGRDQAGEPGAPRDVSIEELIDLEQQAEFFVVLGQDESAIDLLVEHLRHTGGGSPLPYLKLLEIYRRRGDRDAYERTRGRFNHRFNAYAPQWDSELAHGRSLEDYAEVLPRLQQVWPRPLDAMAELEALLFRKSRGELFELPAYREVLFLYALARDLYDREAAATGNVDLLLPLGAPGDAAPGLAPRGISEETRPDDRPTAPVDLDLTLDEARGSLFQPPPGAPKR